MRARLLALSVLLACGLTGTASAATTIGDADTIPNVDAGNAFYAATAIGGDRVPGSGGVITSLSTTARLTSGSSGKARLYVVRGEFPTLTIVGSAEVTVTSSVYQKVTTPARIPVLPGDHLAAAATGASGVAFGFFSKTGSDIDYANYGNAIPDGSSVALAPYAGGYDVSVAGSLEPDADHDGYGDETQDSCPTLPAIHTGPCPSDLQTTIATTPATIAQGDVATVIATIKNGGAGPAVGAIASLTLPAGLQVVAASTTGGECDGATCALGDVPVDATRKVVLVLRGVTPGIQTIGVVAHSQSVEQSNANDGATTQLAVAAAPATQSPGPSVTPVVKLCTIPSLKGKTEAAAKSALAAAGCVVGKIAGSKAKTAKVSTQTLPSKLVVLAGTKVGFTLKAAKKAAKKAK